MRKIYYVKFTGTGRSKTISRRKSTDFGSYKEYDMTNHFFNPSLAGGALLDIGVYALSFVRWFMSSAPDQIVSQVKMAPSGVDEQAGILLMNPSGEMATIALTLHAKQPKRGTLAFDKGYIEIIYVFLTIFLYLLKCPQSLILSALRAFCFCGKPHISRSIFLYFRYQSWLKSW